MQTLNSAFAVVNILSRQAPRLLNFFMKFIMLINANNSWNFNP